MNHHLVEVGLVVHLDTDVKQLQSVFDALADAVADIGSDDHGPLDGDVGMTVAERLISLAITLDDDDDDERAARRGLAAVRAAVHAAGGPTGVWEKFTVARERVQVA
ncbi:hypothetical protein [Gordonia sp. (in: high G+C Gram-positive bacteria)]|uniref:hypothetical protein n=1 Tax=unclassified Gordonia (in: high G+C Gram-positive bacteria) TaxID=2657482 RepID=UPI002625273A|nr:hypothetical protein [Gordonia sp. (in: high G+C Gram-positive bacteria)]